MQTHAPNHPDVDALPAQAMLLAAGRGERMRPLTDHTPKPMLTVRGQPLLYYPLRSLAAAGVHQVLINTAWLEAQIAAHFGDHFSAPHGSSLSLRYSHEGRDFGDALETAGGIVRALPHLDEVFWVAAGDVYAPDFSFPPDAHDRFKAGPLLAQIWLVPNPAHNPLGDFGLSADGRALNLPRQPDQNLFTFSTIALYKRAFFQAAWCPIPMGNPKGVKAPLAAMLRAAMDQGLVGATLYEGLWVDVGTPERLALLNI